MTGDATTEGMPRSLWSPTAGCVLLGVLVVVALLVPIDPSARTWVVRASLVVLLLGACAVLGLTGRVEPTRANRLQRVAYQTAFFWVFFTGCLFAVPMFGHEAPVRSVLEGIVVALFFGGGVWMLDPWVVERRRRRETSD